jgi:polysaccharide biosynthesis protein PelG
MAGIGFELRKMIDGGQGLIGAVRGYACAGLISSGPWILTILTLGVLSAFAPFIAEKKEFDVFRGLVTYSFAFSLITVGVVQMTVTRRIADLLYSKKYDEVLPAFNATMMVVGAAQVVVGGFFCWLADLPGNLSFVAVSLYVIVSLTWLTLIWLGVTREFDRVLKAYGLGSLVFGILVACLGRPCTALGLLAAWAAGQAVVLTVLVSAILRGLQVGGKRSFAVLNSVKAFPRLMLVGVVYNAAIWIDKIIFWFTDGVGPHPWILFHPMYDTCCFMAYLTVIPALAVNLVRVETSFYECYRAYFGAILGGMPLRIIDARRTDMFANMQQGTIHLIRVQGAITVLVMLFAPQIMAWLELPPTAVRIFRVVCLAAFFHVMLLITVLMQLYFDLRRQALMTSLLFFTLNTVLAIWSVQAGLETYGFGAAIAGLISLIAGYAMLVSALKYLDFYTFTGQPITDD